MSDHWHEFKTCKKCKRKYPEVITLEKPIKDNCDLCFALQQKPFPIFNKLESEEIQYTKLALIILLIHKRATSKKGEVSGMVASFGKIDKRLILNILKSLVKLKCGFPFIFDDEYNISDDINAVRFIPISIDVKDWKLWGIQFNIKSLTESSTSSLSSSRNELDFAIYDTNWKLFHSIKLSDFEEGLNTWEDPLKLKIESGVYWLGFSGPVCLSHCSNSGQTFVYLTHFRTGWTWPEKLECNRMSHTGKCLFSVCLVLSPL